MTVAWCRNASLLRRRAKLTVSRETSRPSYVMQPNTRTPRSRSDAAPPPEASCTQTPEEPGPMPPGRIGQRSDCLPDFFLR